jgi:hypothetical protein
VTHVELTSVTDPETDPAPEGSKTFGWIQIRSGTEINISDPDPKHGNNFSFGSATLEITEHNHWYSVF